MADSCTPPPPDVIPIAPPLSPIIVPGDALGQWYYGEQAHDEAFIGTAIGPGWDIYPKGRYFLNFNNTGWWQIGEMKTALNWWPPDVPFYP